MFNVVFPLIKRALIRASTKTLGSRCLNPAPPLIPSSRLPHQQHNRRPEREALIWWAAKQRHTLSVVLETGHITMASSRVWLPNWLQIILCTTKWSWMDKMMVLWYYWLKPQSWTMGYYGLFMCWIEIKPSLGLNCILKGDLSYKTQIRSGLALIHVCESDPSCLSSGLT